VPRAERTFSAIDGGADALFSLEKRCRSNYLASIRKPHPQIFKTTLDALQVAPHEAVFVGDRVPEDVAGARRVGMPGVWKERPDRQRFPEVIPDAQFVHFRELMAILDFWTEGNRA
jgi:FMN phosphatase YigB (HAD superfamily)